DRAAGGPPHRRSQHEHADENDERTQSDELDALIGKQPREQGEDAEQRDREPDENTAAGVGPSLGGEVTHGSDRRRSERRPGRDDRRGERHGRATEGGGGHPLPPPHGAARLGGALAPVRRAGVRNRKASSRALSALDKRMPTPRPTTDANRPTRTASVSTDTRTWRPLAPMARSRAISRSRCATTIENVLKMMN